MSSSQIPFTTQEALTIQRELRERVIVKDDFKTIQIIAGVDVGYNYAKNICKAALVLMRRYETIPSFSFCTTDHIRFPYIPGLLSFREVPVICKLLEELDFLPDLLMIDGQGIAHPRGIGIASHIGTILDIPAIGVAKSVLCGKYEEPAMVKNATSPLIYKEAIVGTVLRSRGNVKPIFISPGHKISHETALAIVQEQITRYRLPEPVRQADKLSKFV
jgi:deoxyribonuclease V